MSFGVSWLAPQFQRRWRGGGGEIFYVEQLELKRRSREGEEKQNEPSSGVTKIMKLHSGAVTKGTVGTRFLNISFFLFTCMK